MQKKKNKKDDTIKAEIKVEVARVEMEPEPNVTLTFNGEGDQTVPLEEIIEYTEKEDYFSRAVFPKVLHVPVMYLSGYKQSVLDMPVIVVHDVKSQEDVLKDLAAGQTRLEVDATVCNPIGTYEQARLERTGLLLSKAVSEPIPIDDSMCARLVATNRKYVKQPHRRRARLYMRFTFDIERCALAHKNKQKNDERFRG